MVLDGLVTSSGPGGPTNLPLVGATVEVYAVNAATGERRGAPLLRTSILADGRWGPLATDAQTPLEFVVSAPGYAIHHVYRSPFPRSSAVVHLRPERLSSNERNAGRGGQLRAAARLLRRAARPHRVRRTKPGAGHSERRGRRRIEPHLVEPTPPAGP